MGNQRYVYDDGFFTYAERQRNQGVPWTFILWCLLAVFSTFMFMLTILFAWDLSLFALPWILFSLSWCFREPREYRTEPFIPTPHDYVAMHDTAGWSAGGIAGQPYGYSGYMNGNGYSNNHINSHGYNNNTGGYTHEVSRQEKSPLPNFGGFRKEMPVDFMKDAKAAQDRRLWEKDRVGEVDKTKTRI
ncbi:hypothetical protein Dda_4682 [Drechslerella dactyloides]|uniref:Uncharacterized protein n=1 Tax=Drechslerella dactyloides TaxID=74499 RepID=A0AAD6NI53_DREDA|nr:hypothetical protein Dda_4682 [Drechslerella dactyloides]